MKTIDSRSLEILNAVVRRETACSTGVGSGFCRGKGCLGEAAGEYLEARAAAVLALVGVVNLPIIKFSVDWWNTLHQPASISRLGAPTIDPAFLTPLLLMAAAFTAFFITMLLIRTRTEVTARKVRALRLVQAGQ